MTKTTPAKGLTGFKKREQIDAAQKTVFLWAIIATISLALCIVVGYFLVREIAFTAKIYGEKQATSRVLSNNLIAAEELETNVQKLIANGDLARARANDSDSNYKVVLDALPVTDDATVLGSSLLQEILTGSNVEIESLSTGSGLEGSIAPPAEDAAVLDDAGMISGEAAIEEPTVTPITFQFTVTGTVNQITVMFRDLERSIRPMNVRIATIQASGNTLQVNVQGESYYSSPKSVQLTEKQVQP